MLRIAEVLRTTGVSTATLYRWIKDGTFPAPVRLGTNSVGWRESEIRDWLESREPVGSPSAAGLDEPPQRNVEEASSPTEAEP